MIVNYHRKFKKSFSKLPAAIQEKTVSSIDKFVNNPRDQALGVHPLHGKLIGRSSFSITAAIRVVFIYKHKELVLMLDVGDHDQVY